jgi:hypothetical protein
MTQLESHDRTETLRSRQLSAFPRTLRKNAFNINESHALSLEHRVGTLQHGEIKPLCIRLENINVIYAGAAAILVNRIKLNFNTLLHRAPTILSRRPSLRLLNEALPSPVLGHIRSEMSMGSARRRELWIP